MSANSKRELIILDFVSKLGTIPTIATVERKKPQLNELDGIAETQLPMAVVLGKLPVPQEIKWSSREQGVPDYFISDLDVEVLVYGRDNVTPDSSISNFADDIWEKLYSDPTIGGLIRLLQIKPDVDTLIYDPYFMFRMVCTVTYQHQTGGI